MLTQPTLMQLTWFARLFAKWMAFKDRIPTRVKTSLAWGRMVSLKNTIKTTSKALSNHVKRLLRR